ncbi:MAG TPA: cyclodeaminase/cyclohydrolase family protein, partial [Gemmatimonadaceae bacterium]|nr:cyclodeaminase/cyclohydrolase family protein [Gemmatimonadaceae bacterium]
LEVDGQAQVSMNLVDIEKTPMFRAYDMVKMEAAAHGVSPTWSELVGLVPERAVIDAAARYLQLRNFSTEQLLEHKVRAAASGGVTVSGFRASVASANPAPGGGSVAAHAGSLAAALVQMVAGLTIGRKKYADVDATFQDIAQQAASLGQRLAQLVELDAQSYEAVSAAYKLPKATPEQESNRKAAITAALIGASEVPLETARACATVASLAEVAARQGNANARSDAGVAALMAEAGCRGAAFNVKVNVDALDDSAAAHGLTEAAENFVRDASDAAKRTAELVLGG